MIVAFLAGLLFSCGVLLFRSVFYQLSLKTVELLNVVLNDKLDDDTRQNLLIKKLSPVLLSLLLFVTYLFFCVLLAWLPFVIEYYIHSRQLVFNLRDLPKIEVILMIGGSVIPFIIFGKLNNDEVGYSELARLLHRMILNNYSISKQLFEIEVRSKKLKQSKKNFVIISGLARAGTTAFTTQMHKTGKFLSLSYANMPFLLSPNLWAKVYKPNTDKLKERSHGDNVMFGLGTVEALEEYFWKVFTENQFITNNSLVIHEIEQDTYEQYHKYQSLILKPNSDRIYLAKNNNFLLRYDSLRKYNDEFKLFILFRDPISHAQSLLTQHLKFLENGQKEPFVVEYMDWLGHHEFGVNAKPFDFGERKYIDKSQITYWVESWAQYYQQILSRLGTDRNMYLVSYEEFCNDPNKVLNLAMNLIDKSNYMNEMEPYYSAPLTIPVEDENLKNEAYEIYNELSSLTINKSNAL